MRLLALFINFTLKNCVEVRTRTAVKHVKLTPCVSMVSWSMCRALKPAEVLKVVSVEGDEQIEGMSLAVMLEPPEFFDSAILEAKPAQPLFRYSREELSQLGQVALSQKRPNYFNTVYNKNCLSNKGGEVLRTHKCKTSKILRGKLSNQMNKFVNDKNDGAVTVLQRFYNLSMLVQRR